MKLSCSVINNPYIVTDDKDPEYLLKCFSKVGF